MLEELGCKVISNINRIVVIFFISIIINGLEPGWLGTPFGLGSCYVRIIITRWKIILVYKNI
jgi:hypothetical protein